MKKLNWVWNWCQKVLVENFCLTTELVLLGGWIDEWMDGGKSSFKGLLIAVQKISAKFIKLNNNWCTLGGNVINIYGQISIP
jgi:hypothetical protein